MHLLLLFPSHSFRIELSNTVANAAGVPLGNVLVYDVVQFNYSQESCLSATLRFTGASGEYQVEEWAGLLPQVVGGAVTSRGGQGCHPKGRAGLSFQEVGVALDLTERTGLSLQVVGVVIISSGGYVATSGCGWGSHFKRWMGL